MIGDLLILSVLALKTMYFSLFLVLYLCFFLIYICNAGGQTNKNSKLIVFFKGYLSIVVKSLFSSDRPLSLGDVTISNASLLEKLFAS